MKSRYKILLITDSFPPAFAPRMGYLCKYIKNNTNWSVDCLCSNRGNGYGSHASTFSHLEGFVQHIYDYEWEDGIHKISLKNVLLDFVFFKNSLSKSLRILYGKLYYLMFHRGTLFNAYNQIRKVLTQKKYDLILTSSGGGRCYELGAYAQKISKLPIIHDFRDVMEQEIGYNKGGKIEWQRKALLVLRNKAVSAAEHIVCTTIGQYNVLKEYNSRITLIHNGYDPEIFSPCKPANTNTFNIVYIGSIYTGQYPVELICDAFSTFCEKHKNANVLFYSTQQTFDENISPFLKEGRASDKFICMRTCPQTEMLRVFAQASVLTAMHRSCQTGVECISSKVFEYLAANRQILYVKNEISSRLEVVDILEKTKAGAVAGNKEQILEFLEEKYSEWIANGFVKGTTDRQYAERFSRASEAAEYLKIIEKVAFGT